MATARMIPTAEGNFTAWVNNYVNTLVNNVEEFHISEDEVEQLNTGLAQWDEDYAAAVAARDQARAAVEAKDMARAELESIVRETARRIQADSRVTDAARRDAGLPVHKTKRSPIGVPTTNPRGQVMATERLEHTVSISDASTPTRRSKPHGVVGCEVFVFVGETAPSDPAAFDFIGVWTRTPERVCFKSDKGGQIAHYLFRWMNTKGETGPWSDVTSATIPAV